MRLETKILIDLWLVMTILIIVVVPKAHFRRYLLGSLVCQCITWFSILLHVHFKLLAYPVREFPKATDLGFSMPYMVYPIMAGLYMVYEPRHSLPLRVAYLFLWCCGVAVFHYTMAKYTDLLNFVHYHWFFSGATSIIVLLLTSTIVRWFFYDPPWFYLGKRRRS